MIKILEKYMDERYLVIKNGVLIECNNTAVGHIDIPNTVKEIKYEAFEGCELLESIGIPDSVHSIYFSKLAFEDCPDLTIKCHKDSYSDFYARSHGVKVEYI